MTKKCPKELVPLLNDLTLSEIAERAGVSIYLATRWRDELAPPKERWPGRPRLECPADLVPRLSDMTIKEVAEEAGVSTQVAARWRREHDAPSFYGGPLPKPLPKGFVERYERGDSFSEIGRAYGISRQRAHQLARREGLPPRMPVEE